jgi:hypothetical protein
MHCTTSFTGYGCERTYSFLNGLSRLACVAYSYSSVVCVFCRCCCCKLLDLLGLWAVFLLLFSSLLFFSSRFWGQGYGWLPSRDSSFSFTCVCVSCLMALEWYVCVHEATDYIQTEKGERERERERKKKLETSGGQVHASFASLVGHSIGRLVVLLSTCNRYIQTCIYYFALKAFL